MNPAERIEAVAALIRQAGQTKNSRELARDIEEFYRGQIVQSVLDREVETPPMGACV